MRKAWRPTVNVQPLDGTRASMANLPYGLRLWSLTETPKISANWKGRVHRYLLDWHILQNVNYLKLGITYSHEGTLSRTQIFFHTKAIDLFAFVCCFSQSAPSKSSHPPQSFLSSHYRLTHLTILWAHSPYETFLLVKMTCSNYMWVWGFGYKV